MGGMQNHSEGQHFLVLENGRLAYVSVPHELAGSMDDGELCFTDHRKEGVPSETCCLQESGHVHAHVHHGEITQDVLLEQCMEESGCTLPVLREICNAVFPLEESDHEHMEGCGHTQIAHGDHIDWLIPLKDGSFSIQNVQNGLSSFIEHGRLVNIGQPLAKLKRRPMQHVPLFSYESPKHKGYETLSQTDEDVKDPNLDIGLKQHLDDNSMLMPSPSVGRNVVQGGMLKVDIPGNFKGSGLCKTRLDVMGICCPSEVPLIKKLLHPLAGVEEVSINVTSKTVIVLHDQLLITDVQLVKALNAAHLDASIHQRGELKAGRKLPSPWCVGCGILVAIAFFHYLYSPLKWVALGAVAIGVPPLILKAIAALRKFVLDINMLMLIAVGGAVGLGDYLEAGTIVFLFTLADWLESRSTDKARSAIAAVVDRAPQSAVLLDGGIQVRVEDVEVGTFLSVKAGDTIPIDGEVISGKSSVDESSLTGESVPVEKEVGATVWAGTMNMSGYLTMKTTALSVDSAVARMVRLVEEAQKQRSSTEMLVEKIAKYYTPAIVLAAIFIGVVPWASGIHNPGHWVYLALVLLVVACPCALVISTPVVVTCGIAQAAHLGLLIKGGTYLEILGKLKVVALDKTGTLTEGHFRVSDVLSVDDGTSLQDIMYWIASVENKASHPLAAALVSYAHVHGVQPSDDVTDFEVIAGEGVSAIVNGHTVHIGNARMAARLGWNTASGAEMVEIWSSLGATVGWIGLDGTALGIYSVGDQLRVEAVEAVRELKKLGIRVAMLTGDSSSAAAYAHQKIGEIDIHAELLPEDKVRLVQDLKKNAVLAMVGDGINDAPALAAADVGIAMGVAGSAVAMETADVALMTNDLRKLAAAVHLGQSCRWKIWQNVTFSFVTKLLIIGLAAGGHASLWAAVLADVGTCLVVIFNSMRLLKKGKKHAGHDHCISKKLAMDKKKCSKGCCEKDEAELMPCLEDKAVEDTQAPAVAHKHRGRFPWLHHHRHRHHHHHHHHHHHEKKEKCEKEDSCCTDKEDHAPCCSSARCEQKVLISRGKGHRNSHVFGTSMSGIDRIKSSRNDIELCGSQCCTDSSATLRTHPKISECQSTLNCCVTESISHTKELNQKSLFQGTDAMCCSEDKCKDSAIDYASGASKNSNVGCCGEGDCKSAEAPTKVLFGNNLQCCSTGKCEEPALEFHMKDITTEVCSKRSCESSHEKDISTVERSKDRFSDRLKCANVSKATGHCGNGSCKSAEAGGKVFSDGYCCSSGKCTSSSLGVSTAGSEKSNIDCCVEGSCNSAPVKKTLVARKHSVSDVIDVARVKSGTGCCASGSCKSTQGDVEVLPALSAAPKASSASNECLAIGDHLTSIGMCCDDPSSCKSCVAPIYGSDPCQSASIAKDLSKDKISEMSNGVRLATMCCTNGSCKSVGVEDTVSVANLPAIKSSSAANDRLVTGDVTLSFSVPCAGASSCECCVGPPAPGA